MAAALRLKLTAAESVVVSGVGVVLIGCWLCGDLCVWLLMCG